jgi:hypothetical protein
VRLPARAPQRLLPAALLALCALCTLGALRPSTMLVRKPA